MTSAVEQRAGAARGHRGLPGCTIYPGEWDEDLAGGLHRSTLLGIMGRGHLYPGCRWPGH